MRRLPIELSQGQLKVAVSGLFLDAHRKSACAFVSHAHGDHIARHERTIATEPTVALMRHRLGAKVKSEALPVGYRQPFGLGDLTLELFPAGHVLGSAQLRVTRGGVALGYALGKAQEILKYLGEAGYPCRAHPVVHAVNRVYEAQGVPLPNVALLGPEGPARGEVVVAPPHLARTSPILRIPNRRTAVLTGWAIDGRGGFRGADAAFPLSDHADFPSLMRYAKASGARRVLTVHGYARELAGHLRREGIRAEPLVEQEQLELL